jgi:predicted ATPase
MQERLPPRRGFRRLRQTLFRGGEERAPRVGIEPTTPRLELKLQHEGLLRPHSAAELLLWIAALLTPTLRPSWSFNEPETSLHPDLMPALARLIRHTARETQVWVVSHASRLISALEEDSDCHNPGKGPRRDPRRGAGDTGSATVALAGAVRVGWGRGQPAPMESTGTASVGSKNPDGDLEALY